MTKQKKYTEIYIYIYTKLNSIFLLLHWHMFLKVKRVSTLQQSCETKTKKYYVYVFLNFHSFTSLTHKNYVSIIRKEYCYKYLLLLKITTYYKYQNRNILNFKIAYFVAGSQEIWSIFLYLNKRECVCFFFLTTSGKLFQIFERSLLLSTI